MLFIAMLLCFTQQVDAQNMWKGEIDHVSQQYSEQSEVCKSEYETPAVGSFLIDEANGVFYLTLQNKQNEQSVYQSNITSIGIPAKNCLASLECFDIDKNPTQVFLFNNSLNIYSKDDKIKKKVTYGISNLSVLTE